MPQSFEACCAGIRCSCSCTPPPESVPDQFGGNVAFPKCFSSNITLIHRHCLSVQYTNSHAISTSSGQQIMNKISLLLVLQFTLPASAQTLINADTSTIQPLINRDAEGFQSCGVRVVTGSLKQFTDSELYDFSLGIWKDGTVLFKAGSYFLPPNGKGGWDIKKLKLKTPGPTSFWAAKRDDSTAARPTTYVKSEDPGFSLGMPEAKPGMEVVYAIAHGEPIQVALRYGAGNRERIIAFQEGLQENDMRAFSACMTGLIKRMETSLPPD
jgi:hypothetical protein